VRATFGFVGAFLAIGATSAVAAISGYAAWTLAVIASVGSWMLASAVASQVIEDIRRERIEVPEENRSFEEEAR